MGYYSLCCVEHHALDICTQMFAEYVPAEAVAASMGAVSSRVLGVGIESATIRWVSNDAGASSVFMSAVEIFLEGFTT